MYPIQTARYIMWRLNERLGADERGQVASEYVGMIVVIAAIVLALKAFGQPIASAISEGIQKTIRGMFGGGTAQTPPPPGG